MKRIFSDKFIPAIVLLTALFLFSCTFVAKVYGEPLRIGIIASYSGPYADYGRQFDAGIEVYLSQHKNLVAGREVEIIRKDTSGAAPDLALRHAKELILRDKVHLISGLDFSPNAAVLVPLLNQAKVPTIIMNAAASGLTTGSPYMSRVAFTVAQVSAPMAVWMRKQGISSVYTIVADYASGHDAEMAFTDAFIAAGGTISGKVRTPLNNPDFAAYVQKIKDDAPEAVFMFFPSGVMPPAFLKAWHERGLDELGIKLFATGEATDDSYLEVTGEVALGLITSHHYSYAHDSDLNKEFIKSFRALYGNSFRPSYFAVAAYDALSALDSALTKNGGSTNPDDLMRALSGLRFESPRGVIEIDKTTRDIVQPIYIRETVLRDGELVNAEFHTFDFMSDPNLRD